MGDVEIRVSQLKRVEGPLDEIEAPFEGVFSLCQLQLLANALTLVLRQDCRHVRVQVGTPFTNARKCQKKSNHFVLFEGAQHLAASSMSNHEHVMRHDLWLRTAPNTLLQVHA